MTFPVVAIVGRPNVGKSSLFNRILRSRHAITDDEPGSTRDRNCKLTQWSERNFILVDTGGYVPVSATYMDSLVNKQVEYALEDADVILFILDAMTGITEMDMMIAEVLRKSEGKGGAVVIPVMNKADNESFDNDRFEYLRLGLGEPVPISAKNGRSTDLLMDMVMRKLPDEGEDETGKFEKGLRLAVVGRTNVGKSSIVNKLVGDEVVIASSTEGTTRDSTDTILGKNGRTFILVDTAGLKRKGREEDGVGFYSYLRSLRTIERSDVVILVLDASRGISSQDAWIGRMTVDAGRGVVVAVNKWDLIEKDNYTYNEYEMLVKKKLRFIDYAPVVFLSAVSGQRVNKILDLSLMVWNSGGKRISTPELNIFIKKATKTKPVPISRGKHPKVLYAAQTGIHPPVFTLFTNSVEPLPVHYQRYLVNRIRDEFDFTGNPIFLKIKNRKKR